MVAKRIIPCLDVKDGRTVKGVNFVDLRDVGDAVELGQYYAHSGADELVYLDISASREGRATFTRLVERISDGINIRLPWVAVSRRWRMRLDCWMLVLIRFR